MKPVTLIAAAAATAIGAAAAPATAADMSITVEIPRIQSAEYHSPYVAIWIEQPDQTGIITLANWYAVDLRNNEGLNWIQGMRTWWRKLGNRMTLPTDGVSGATRAPGRHTITVPATHPALRDLPAGQYTIGVEALREGGGREVVRVPFQWNGQAQTASAQGAAELGAVSINITG